MKTFTEILQAEYGTEDDMPYILARLSPEEIIKCVDRYVEQKTAERVKEIKRFMRMTDIYDENNLPKQGDIVECAYNLKGGDWYGPVRFVAKDIGWFLVDDNLDNENTVADNRGYIIYPHCRPYVNLDD